MGVHLASTTESVSLAPVGGTWLQREGSYDVYSVGEGRFEFTSAPVTFASLKRLVASFSTRRGVTVGLNVILTAAAATRSAWARNVLLDVLIAQVNAQTERAFTPRQAELLVTLATALR